MGSSKTFWINNNSEDVLSYCNKLFKINPSQAIGKALEKYWEPIILSELEKRGESDQLTREDIN